MAVSDWMRSVPDQIARWVPGTYQSLGADGFGFADTRGAARRFFHIDAQSIVLAVLTELAKEGKVDRSVLKQAIDRYQLLDVAAADPGAAGGDAYVPDQIARWEPGTYQSLGADGFGFADTRGAARRFVHIDAQSFVRTGWTCARCCCR